MLPLKSKYSNLETLQQNKTFTLKIFLTNQKSKKKDEPILGFLKAYAVKILRRASIPGPCWNAGCSGNELKTDLKIPKIFRYNYST